MAAIDLNQVLTDSITAVKTIAGSSWNDLKPYAAHEFTQFSENAEFLAKLRLANAIDDGELKARLELQKIALQNVLLTIHGIALLTAQNIINAILGILSTAIEAAIGIVLPI